MDIFENFKEIDGRVVDDTWIEWWHINVPNKNDWYRKLVREILALFHHCLKCTALDGCYFVKWNMPKSETELSDGLLHPHCDCKINPVNKNKVAGNARANCPREKFLNYVFSENSNGKKDLFESWGYSQNDTPYLINEYCKQARDNYISGKYILKELDQYGQRMAIPIKLRDDLIFYTGWMLYPEGELQNTTPFGGRVK